MVSTISINSEDFKFQLKSFDGKYLTINEEVSAANNNQIKDWSKI